VLRVLLKSWKRKSAEVWVLCLADSSAGLEGGKHTCPLFLCLTFCFVKQESLSTTVLMLESLFLIRVNERGFRMKKLIDVMFCGVLMIMSNSGAFAQNASDIGGQSLRDKLNRSLGGASQGQLQVIGIRETPMAGLLEVELSSGEVLFTDRAGDFLLTGDFFQATADGLVNLSNETRKLKIVAMIAAVPQEEMIIYRPEVVKESITVFTDADCTFCRKLHGDIEEILERGIEVRYLAFPRGGAASEVFPKMISIWCSDDRQKALTQAKNGQNLPERECNSPVLKHYELGNQVGISGTPALVLKDGTVIPGYLDVERLSEIVLGQ
jgi:thiol:disulfide interchange protein DsbC